LAEATFLILNFQTTKGGNWEDLGYYIKSSATFVNEGSGTWNLTMEDRSWSLFMNNSWQTVCVIDHAHPLETISEDADGNKMAVHQFQSNLHAGETVNDYIVYHVRSKPRSIPSLDYGESGTLADIPNDLQEKYCSNKGFWMINDSGIREKALEIAGNETRILGVVAKLVSWIWTNIKYQSHDPALYPNETLSLREGDCDEQAILFGTFCRILGIPSHLQVGCVFQPGSDSSDDDGHIHYTEKQIGWHAWSITYIPPWGWLPVDLTYVIGSRTDALNAIRNGAVTLQYTVQNMNVSENDYLASERAYKDLLQQNNFSLYVTDEMEETSAVLGDLNWDETVNILDIAIVAKAFETRPNDENWNATADINKDGMVNILDMSMVAREYRETG
jgi:hypothetical protein